MSNVEILRKIIEEEGNCAWARESTCTVCPLSKLRKKDDGNYVSCIEAIGVEELDETDADRKYKEAALRKLIELEVEQALEETDGA